MRHLLHMQESAFEVNDLVTAHEPGQQRKIVSLAVRSVQAWMVDSKSARKNRRWDKSRG